METKRTTRMFAAGVLVLALAAGATACGDDDGGAAAALPAKVCDAGVELGGVFAMAPEDPSEFADFASTTVQPLLAALQEGATGHYADHAAELSEVWTTIAETGDPSAIETPAYTEAANAIGEMVHTKCGAHTVGISGVDYAFEGAPDELDAGLVSIRFTNDGNEEHELVLMRRADGVDESLEELLALPQEEAMSKLEMKAVTFAPPGGESYTAAELDPGTYFLICFIPVGGGPEGEPHFAHGMQHTFTVA